MDRTEICGLICARIREEGERCREEFRRQDRIRSFYIDDLLPEALARQIYAAFPPAESMRLQKSLREDKYTGFELDRYEPILAEAIYAFQDRKLVDLLGGILGIEDLQPDDSLYLGGISLMTQGQFLNPHIDNSHDSGFKNFRMLNLLYYVSPEWKPEYGGHFELWDRGVKSKPRVIECRFNRLVVMATYRTSWHSVKPITAARNRCCVSNYYFAPRSFDRKSYFHGTYFRGRPEQHVRDLVLRGEVQLKKLVRVVTGTGRPDRVHVYKHKTPQ